MFVEHHAPGAAQFGQAGKDLRNLSLQPRPAAEVGVDGVFDGTTGGVPGVHDARQRVPAFAPETITWLADRGVVLVGTDSASVDPANSKTLDSHQVLRQRGLRVLENLLLDEVPEGDYELIALPLKLISADASPVRAVLREL